MTTLNPLHPGRALAGIGLLCLCLLAAGRAAAATDDFSANALRGLNRFTVAVEGIPANFARYGLTAGELQQQIEQRLSAYGIEVVGAAAAQTDNAVGQLRIKLNAVEDFYAYYSYALSAQARRKLPLAPDGSSFVSHTVWSQGQNGVINPSDLKKVYGFVDELLDAFVAAHDAHNAPAHTVMTR